MRKFLRIKDSVKLLFDEQETDGAIYQCQVLIALTDKETADVPHMVRQPPIISDNSTRFVVKLSK